VAGLGAGADRSDGSGGTGGAGGSVRAALLAGGVGARLLCHKERGTGY